MKHINKLFLVIVLISLTILAIPGRALAASPAGSTDDKVVLGGTYTLSSGQTLDGNLAVIGGSATIEKDAVVTGDAVLTGGTLDISGEIQGNIAAFGGTVFLNDDAMVNGNISLFGATVHQAAGAKVQGKTVNGSQGPFHFNVPSYAFNPWRDFTHSPIWEFYAWFGRTLALAFLAILVVLIVPDATARVSQTAAAQPVLAGGYGLLTALVVPIVLILMIFTILLIPISALGLLAFAVAVAYGWIAVSLETGRRINRISKVEWAPAIRAGVGSLALSTIVEVLNLVPCVGWLAGVVICLVGLGAVILTRFGTRDYPPSETTAPSTPPAQNSRVVDVYPTTSEPPQTASNQPPAGQENL
ncbi:MAG TPA: polymer-forming cytoskeletal protein [Anaerolineaceae bacterium]|nr:polymer-forming cytoskeletal protein [Anaerolineaceae bacterium]